MWIKQKNSIWWLSLFEVLVAIIIFGVWILTIFSLVINNISWVKTIRVKNTATMLAKEWLEIAYHMRDTNLERWIVWDCIDFDTWAASDHCGWLFYDGSTSIYGGSGNDYIIDRDIGGDDYYNFSWVSSESQGLLYLHTGNVASTGSAITWFWYNHIASLWTSSIYTRIITFAPSSLYPSNTWNVLQIFSRVFIQEWSSQREIVLESVIWCTFGDSQCY